MVDVRYETAFTLYPYERSADQDAQSPARHPVVIVGGGPVGMGMALELGLKNVPCVVLDDHDGVGVGSRAICFAKRTLEICDRMGAADPMVDLGVVWNVGRVFRDERQIYDFNLLPEEGHKRPAFINLQQPYFEKFLVERIRAAQAEGAPIEIRGKNRVLSVDSHDDHVVLEVDTPEGPYRMEADYMVACDGARSPVRTMLGHDFTGRVFEDNFLICDVKMTADFPTERWFWFDPPFNRGQSVLLHKQPDDIWRIDFQLGWDIDRKAVVQPEYYMPKVQAMLGEGVEFEPEWVSVYTFQCMSMDEYRHGRVFFAGDSAHQVSPFGARGCNGGIQDVDNLGWKLAAVIKGEAGERLLDTYQEERKHGADENILNSSRTTDFMTPKTEIAKLFRESVLDLVEHTDAMRPLVNSGRLSVPCVYDGSSLNGADDASLPQRTRVGATLVDAPTDQGWLIDRIGGRFQLFTVNSEFKPEGLDLDLVDVIVAPDDLIAERYLGGAEQAVYLIRPDQVIAARWVNPTTADVSAALKTAMGG
ncbi:FAD-dependent oxidoreductase [Neptunicoccus cionae]|uniref:FAD-dependent oxidoreductase n=1 Tax=Neptunicoccus cionae TaxID=2035344 RepID=UPI000C790FB6|nr:FAD-dependent oxidoreductase [Amylibacter cionae]PLS19915.1 FAD-dependent oxidoreductase [Amylibacter cionae]